MLFVWFLLALASVSRACSPNSDDMPRTVVDKVYYSDVVVTGRVIMLRYTPNISPQSYDVTFQVDCVIKGSSGTVERDITITRAGIIEGLCHEAVFARARMYIAYLKVDRSGAYTPIVGPTNYSGPNVAEVMRACDLRPEPRSGQCPPVDNTDCQPDTHQFSRGTEVVYHDPDDHSDSHDHHSDEDAHFGHSHDDHHIGDPNYDHDHDHASHDHLDDGHYLGDGHDHSNGGHYIGDGHDHSDGHYPGDGHDHSNEEGGHYIGDGHDHSDGHYPGDGHDHSDGHYPGDGHDHSDDGDHSDSHDHHDDEDASLGHSHDDHHHDDEDYDHDHDHSSHHSGEDSAAHSAATKHLLVSPAAAILVLARFL